jgi:hypothetical protein
MTAYPGDSRRAGGLDPLDLSARGGGEVAVHSEHRATGLEWSTTAIPIAPLLLMGMAIGPLGINLLSTETLRFFDPAVPVALAVIGALAGMTAGRHVRGRAVLTAAAADVIIAILVLAALATAVGLAAGTAPDLAAVAILGAAAGICAATSISLPSGDAGETEAPETARLDMQVLVAIAAGGLVLAIFRGSSPFAPLLLTIQACVVALVLAAAGWLLLGDATSDTERRVFAAAALLLVGGAADYLALSALLAGLVAGLFWDLVGGQARDGIQRDARYVQRPLVVVMLLLAGARTEPSFLALGLAALYVLGRVASLATARATTRLVGLPRSYGTGVFLPTGVFGIAFALNVVRAAGPDTVLLLTVVVLGTIGAEILAALARRGGTA